MTMRRRWKRRKKRVLDQSRTSRTRIKNVEEEERKGGVEEIRKRGEIIEGKTGVNEGQSRGEG